MLFVLLELLVPMGVFDKTIQNVIYIGFFEESRIEDVVGISISGIFIFHTLENAVISSLVDTKTIRISRVEESVRNYV